MYQKDPFLSAIEMLNYRNAKDCWILNSFLSAFERFDCTISSHNLAFPLLNFDKLDMFSKAIVLSKCMDYKPSILSCEDFGNLMNMLIDTNDFNFKAEIAMPSQVEFLRKFLILTANSQVRFQHTDFRERMARAYALLQYYPNKYKDILKQKAGKNFINIPDVIEYEYGIKPQAFFKFAWIIFCHYYRLIKEVYIIPDETRKTEEAVRMNENKRSSVCYNIIKQMIESIRNSPAKNLLFITPIIEDNTHQVLSKKHFSGFTKIAGRLKKELQEECWKKVYQFGTYSYRLCPLERYPLVKQSDGSFIVPNLRIFEAAIPQILHFELQDIYPGNEYNDLAGTIQEFYLHDLLSQRLPHLPLIPETTYRIGRNELKGPDFTLIDENKRPILIESKSKRFQASTRILADYSSIDTDLQRILAAFEKLPAKYDELFNKIPEYTPYQPFLDSAERNDPIHVVVVSGGIELLAEVVGTFLQHNSNTPLKNYPYKFCIIDLADFEYAVEVAATKTKPLSDLLTEYWTGASNWFAIQNQLPNLYSYKYDHTKSFVGSFVDKLFDE